MKNSWLNSAVFYEVYPTSFRDSNKDGVGDLRGITERLETIREMGFDGIWINACFASEFRDGGYDVTDYYRIDERLGTNQDLEELTQKAARLGMKVLLDLVVGHTSDRHPWFLESCKAEKNKYSDYYIWTDDVFEHGVGCTTVNGVAERNGGYAINFFEFQPALNFGFYQPERPWQVRYDSDATKPLRDEIVSIIMFWLEKGVDGFRVDIANSLVKGDRNAEGCAFVWNYIIGKVREKKPDVIFLAEWSNPSESVGKAGFDMDFLLHSTDEYNSLFRYEPFTNLSRIFEKGHSYFRKEGLGKISPFLGYYCREWGTVRERGYIAIPSGNHDLKRVSYGRSERELKTIFAFLMTFPCVPFVYYGDEIGMPYTEGLKTKHGGYNRTGSRTPMVWNEGKNRGFSDSDQPLYLPVSEKAESFEKQLRKKNSLLSCVRALIALRRIHPQLWADGPFSVDVSYEYPLRYTRGDIRVCIQPAERPCIVRDTVREILLSEGAEVSDGEIRMEGASFIIYR